MNYLQGKSFSGNLFSRMAKNIFFLREFNFGNSGKANFYPEFHFTNFNEKNLLAEN